MQTMSSDQYSAIEHLRLGVAIATACNTANLPPKHHNDFRSKTATWLDDSFFKILSAYDVATLVECGAHEASACVNFMRANNKKALAIEANPHTYETKTKLADRHGVLTINCGLGKETGEIDFFIPKYDQAAGQASFLKKAHEDYDSVKVSVETLDSIASKHLAADEVSALWIDVEGLALEVLKGGHALLNSENCRALKVEVESKAFWENQSMARDVDHYLSRLGYKAILRDMEYENQYNLIYVKEKYIDHIDEILINCWRELANLKLSWPERIGEPRGFIVEAKHYLTRSENSFFSILTHRTAALLGSKSSQEFLKGKGLSKRL